MKENIRGKKLNVILAMHCHQPVGNHASVIESAFRRSYLPFLEMLEKFPGIKVSLHYSGILYDWASEHNRDFFEKLKRLIRRGQVEVIGGGYYEPILPLIPQCDRIGQINLLADFIKKKLGTPVRGAWISERVWEPQLAGDLHDAGIEYTLLDDGHFQSLGMKTEDVLGYFATEDEGKKLLLFVSLRHLRYLTPFANPVKVVRFFKKYVNTRGDRVIVLANDGEKFGTWPGTYELSYRRKWLERFFQALLDNRDWLSLFTFSEFIDREPPKGRIYIPAGSYEEMKEWSGGYFRNFLVKYSESNNMHKRMLEVSARIQSLSKKAGERRLAEARAELYRGQCSCAYWHGVFGGVYLPHLRLSIYQHLIKAEKEVDRISSEEGMRVPAIKVVDFDGDGRDELVVTCQDFKFYLAPERGGSIFEFDYLPRSLNLIDTFTRKREPYHYQLDRSLLKKRPPRRDAFRIYRFLGSKEKRLRRYLRYDNYRKASLIDHFFSPAATLADLREGEFCEAGNFFEHPYRYQLKSSAEEEKNEIKVTLSRQGEVSQDEKNFSVRVTKTINKKRGNSKIFFLYLIENLEREKLTARFSVEFNLSLRDERLSRPGRLVKAGKFCLQDKAKDIIVTYRFNQPAEVWHLPVETVSASEGGMERIYQGLTLFFNWHLELEGKSGRELKFSQRIE